MKKNAQKILVALYKPRAEVLTTLDISKLRKVVPDLTETGYRSLLLYMSNKDYIFREKVLDTNAVGITELGQRSLTAIFPALDRSWDTWKGEWVVMLFLSAPKTDPHFRYLRSLLIQEKAFPITRGVYLTARSFSDKILREIEVSYPKSIALLSVNSWLKGVDRPLIFSYYGITGLVESYSGVSKEIDLLLEKKAQNKDSFNQSKFDLISVIDRLLDCLRQDPGFHKFYFPDMPGGAEVIRKMQSLITL